MNRDEMIENIADYIQIASDLYRIECIKVAKYLVENKNCRIIADDEIVIKSDIKCVDSTTAVNVIDFFAKYNAKVRQETAIEILQEIFTLLHTIKRQDYEDGVPYYSEEVEIFNDRLSEIFNKYGIELE